MKKSLLLLLLASTGFFSSIAQSADNLGTIVRTVNGTVRGKSEVSGVRSFKGIPFAAPPVRNLRWKEPRPVQNWQGIRNATQFEAKGMQTNIFGDMAFRSKGMSEDCLYLNVWKPAGKARKLPVLVYFYGGGFVAGDGSESRYDGESMATKGIIAITVNYRLGVFGFMAHPQLTKESPHHASGNYGLLDQLAALKWVHQNIAAFGGDPNRVTIAGESAGSVSVSAQMASPLSKNLIASAIGESGSLLGTLPPTSLEKGEQTGLEFAKISGANSLAELRAIPAGDLLEAAAKFGLFRFSMTVDGYFFPKSPYQIYAAGEQAHIPLLAGWNSEETSFKGIMDNEELTKENFSKAVQRLYPEHFEEMLKLYNPLNNEDVAQVATELASDRFIGFSTWKWTDMQLKTGTKPVYRYLFSRPRPAMVAAVGNVIPGLAGGIVKDTTGKEALKTSLSRGAVHSAEIEYAMGNLAGNKVFNWTPDDYKVSKIMQEYFTNFIKKTNPNGPGLPAWPAVSNGNVVEYINIDVDTQLEKERNRGRYLFMDKAADGK